MTSTQDDQTRSRLTGAERRAEILGAAMEVFAERGYHGSSIDEIAKAAGISKALIYEHFPSKRELHASLLEEHVDELIGRLNANAGGSDPGEVRLRAGVDAFFQFVEERREAWRMLFRDSGDPELADTFIRLQQSSTLAVAGLIAADPAAREAPSQRNIEELAQLLSGSVQSLANWWHSHQDVPREELVDRVVDFCWIGLRRLSGSDRG